MARRARRPGRATFCALGAALVALAIPASVSWGSTAGPSTIRASVSPAHVWTDSGVALTAGDTVDIRAAGHIHFAPRPINHMTPHGLPWGPTCTLISHRSGGWPAPGLRCWSLIGRIGSGSPFEIGDALTVRAALAGELFLGVNDNHLGDNFGAWSVSVRLTPRATASTASAPTAQPHSSSSSRLVPIGAVALAVLVVVTLGLVLLARRRAAARRAGATDPEHPEDFLPRPRSAGAPEVPDVPEGEVPAPEAAVAAIETSARPAPADVNLSDDPNDVNIFEVEFPDPASLRVGYSYFPDGTVVRWRVRQSATSGSNGEFVANGGGRAIHFVTIPLGSALEADAEGVDVEFNWEIAGVPFGYSVTRAPA